MALNPLLLRRKRPLRRQAKGIFLDQPLLQALDGRQILKGTFPNHEDVPAGLPQSGLITGVTLLGLPDLFPPPIRPRSREPEVFAVLVPVPIATVDEDEGVVLREDDVRTSGEYLVFWTIFVASRKWSRLEAVPIIQYFTQLRFSLEKTSDMRIGETIGTSNAERPILNLEWRSAVEAAEIPTLRFICG